MAAAAGAGDGAGDGADSKAALEALDAAVAALHRWAAKEEHWKLLVAWHRAHGYAATALAALDEHLAKEKGPPPKEKLELRLDLRELGGRGASATCP